MSTSTARDSRMVRRASSLGLVVVGLGLLGVGLLSPWYLKERIQVEQGADRTVRPAQANYPAPELQLVDLDGDPVSLLDYRGQVLLVNMWATWCPPCKEEMPALEAYYRAHHHQGFTVIAIDAGDPVGEIRRFVAQAGLTFPIWLDEKLAALVAFRYPGLPSSYVVDRSGIVRLTWTGAISAASLEHAITPLLEE